MDVLFNEERWNQLYNCTRYPVDQIPLEQRKNVILGTITLILFVIFEILYALCMFAMSSLLSKSSSYKIMFTLGIAEMVCLINSGLLTGIFAIQGAVFCSAPVFNYCIGILGLFDWDLTTALQVLLAFERCMEQLAPRLAERLFGQQRIYVWFGIIFVYSTYFGIFTMPTLFTSAMFLWDYDPYFGYRSIQQRMAEGLYINRHDEIHNATLAIVIPTLYIVFFICLSFQWRETINFNESQQKLRRSVFIQVFFISMLLFIYVINFYISVWFDVPYFMVVLNQFLWVAIDGLPPVIYLCMNKMIRNRLVQTFKTIRGQTTRVIKVTMATGTATAGKTVTTGAVKVACWSEQRRKSVKNLI